MKNVIVPMDFTEVGINAFKYAYRLFSDSNLHVVYVNSGVTSTREPIYLQQGKNKDSVLKEELEKQIITELALSNLPERIKISVLEGEIIPQTETYVKENAIDAMVVGTRDKYDLFDRWIGTVSLGLVKTINIPTYLVPRYAHFDGYEKVVVASDHHLKNETFLEQIKTWNTQYGAFIKFLHVRAKENDDFEGEVENVLEEMFDTADAMPFGFEIDTVYDKNISQSLLANAYNFGANLLIAIPDNQTFLSSLIFSSISKELILKSTIPILFIHPKEVA